MEDSYLFLKVENNTLYTVWDKLHGQRTVDDYISTTAEQVNSFLETYKIAPTYIDSKYSYGVYDAVNKNWTGMIGHVDES